MAEKRMPVGGLSRYCAEPLRSPNYRRDPDGFIGFLEDLCRRRRPTVFLPLE
ncbi:MAG: hypothetical protein GWO04_19350, partial [Actinobacteria bacterium]|nr:hypothetical protein [Actinomycetota bacterium]